MPRQLWKMNIPAYQQLTRLGDMNGLEISIALINGGLPWQ